MKPLVSIVIPAFNAQNTIVETIESVLNQTYANIELIIVNDGSSDNTVKVIEEVTAGYSHVYMYSTDNQGLPATRNYGFLRSNGEFVVFLDADDLLDENYISSCLDKFRENEELSVVYTQTMFFERMSGIYHLPPFSFEQLLIQNCLTATAMIRSVCFKSVGMYDENMKFCEDWELWLRLIYKYPEVYKIEEPLFLYRKRNSEDSMTDMNKVRNISENAHFYIYNKHYELYKEFGYGIESLFLNYRINAKYKKKYDNLWYRKIYYKLFKRK